MIVSLILSLLRKVFFCHKVTKSQSSTKIRTLIFKTLCNFVFWCLRGIFNFFNFSEWTQYFKIRLINCVF